MISWSFIPNAPCVLRDELEVRMERSWAVGPSRQREAVCISWGQGRRLRRWDFGLTRVGNWEGSHLCSCSERLVAFWPDLPKPTLWGGQGQGCPTDGPSWHLPCVLEGHRTVPAQPLPTSPALLGSHCSLLALSAKIMSQGLVKAWE